MVGQEEWDQEPEDELGRLEPRPAELPPLVESPEAKAHMDQERAVEKDRAGRRLPQQLLEREPHFHRIDRNVAERMVGEVQRHIGEEHKPARKPHPANADRTRASRRLGRGPNLLNLRRRIPPNHVEPNLRSMRHSRMILE